MSDAQAAAAKAQDPSLGDQTGRQAMTFQPTNASMMSGVIGTVDVGAPWGQGTQPRTPTPGIFSQFTMNGLPLAWAGAYSYFRRVLADPSVRYVRALAYAPILATQWEVVGKKNAPKEAAELIHEMLAEHRLQFLDDAVRGIDYGWSPFEQVFDLVKDGPNSGAFWLKKIKPLIHDLTALYVTPSGELSGFNNNGDQIDPAKCLLYTYDAESGNLYGRGRCYNLLEVIPWWRDANDGAAQYDRKIAGVFMVCHYPPGQSVDRDGKVTENWKIAENMLNSIVAGRPIAVCNEFAGEVDTFLQGASPGDRTRWKWELLEDKGSRQPGFKERLTYLDMQKARAWLVPERAAFEAQRSGSKADSESHGDIIQTQAEYTNQVLCNVLTGKRLEPSSVINNILRMNWGREAMGSVYVRPLPIEDDKKKFLRQIASNLLSSAPKLAKVASDVEDILEQAGLPCPSDPASPQDIEAAFEVQVDQTTNTAKKRVNGDKEQLSRIVDLLNGNQG